MKIGREKPPPFLLIRKMGEPPRRERASHAKFQCVARWPARVAAIDGAVKIGCIRPPIDEKLGAKGTGGPESVVIVRWTQGLRLLTVRLKENTHPSGRIFNSAHFVPHFLFWCQPRRCRLSRVQIFIDTNLRSLFVRRVWPVSFPLFYAAGIFVRNNYRAAHSEVSSSKGQVLVNNNTSFWPYEYSSHNHVFHLIGTDQRQRQETIGPINGSGGPRFHSAQSEGGATEDSRGRPG